MDKVKIGVPREIKNREYRVGMTPESVANGRPGVLDLKLPSPSRNGPFVREKRAGVPYVIGEFWTSRQRQGHSLHEISYRACFKAELPEYFIRRFTKKGDSVFDPFMGRGTTPLQAALMGRTAIASDANPLGVMLARPRLAPPALPLVESRLGEIPHHADVKKHDLPLTAFYHPRTLAQLVALKNWFRRRIKSGDFDKVDDWIRMVALNRLSGHSSGFFSGHTLPPNQAVSIASQEKINRRLRQTPPPRPVAELILRKSRSLLRDGAPNMADSRLVVSESTRLGWLRRDSVDLVVTSPPFLNVVDYKSDNWLRLWFADLKAEDLTCTTPAHLDEWRAFIGKTLASLARVVRPKGFVAFEVGEVRNGSLPLEEEVLALAEGLPFSIDSVCINKQAFTKTSNCWGVNNNAGGTNSNRIVVLRHD